MCDRHVGGKQFQSVRIAFKDRDKCLELPVSLQLQHPIDLSQSRIFLGFTKPGSHVQRVITLINHAEIDVVAKTIRASDEKRIELKQSAAILPVGESLIEFNVQTGDSFERQEQQIEIIYANEKIPAQTISVSWINRTE